MKSPRWQRIAARIVLVTFTTCFVACGGAQGEPPATATSTVPVVPATIAVPTTLPADQPPAQPLAPPPAQPPPTLPAEPPDQLNKQQLRDLVAPVALYPDVVLASLLPATTNPDQLHDAAQYVGTAQHVDAVPEDRGWDGSVIGLLQFPDVLRWLDQNPAWTDQMGQAVTYQQGDVLEAIQDYRRAVQNVGNLKSNKYQTVREAPNRDIRIEPAHPDVVYVPSYDPAVATEPQPVQASPGINPWLAFGGGAVVGALGAWALYSIFDDDDDHDHHDYRNDNYYGGRRRIRSYNNYYYARARRPAAVDWAPRPRPRRAAQQGWQHPRRLDYHGQQVQAGKKRGTALRPPRMTSAQQPPKPGQVRREQQQQRREPKQQNRQQQPQRQERTQQQRNQGQKRKQAQQQQRKQKQQGQPRPQQQGQRPEQHQQRQEHQQQRPVQPQQQKKNQQKNQKKKKKQQQQKRQEEKNQEQQQQ